jgi:hypothetical protein
MFQPDIASDKGLLEFFFQLSQMMHYFLATLT